MPIPYNIQTSEILDMTVMKCHPGTFFLNSPPFLSLFLPPSIEKGKDYLKRESKYKGNLPTSFLMIYYLLSNFPNSLVEKNIFSVFHRRMFTWRQVFWDPHHHSHKVMEAKFKPISVQLKKLYLLFNRRSKGNSLFLIPGKKQKRNLCRKAMKGRSVGGSVPQKKLLYIWRELPRRGAPVVQQESLHSSHTGFQLRNVLAAALLMLGISSKVEKGS